MRLETTYTHARANLAARCDQATSSREPIIIQRRGADDVALISAAELRGLTETAHLLGAPKNAQRLIAALLRARENGGTTSRMWCWCGPGAGSSHPRWEGWGVSSRSSVVAGKTRRRLRPALARLRLQGRVRPRHRRAVFGRGHVSDGATLTGRVQTP